MGGNCVNQAAGSDVKDECAADDCNTGACNGFGACGVLEDTTSCSDGDPCTEDDQCFDGICVSGDMLDQDTDTYPDELCGGDDCNDLDPDVNPGADEICGDSIDNDCDDLTDEGCSGCSAVDPAAELVIDNDYPLSGYLLDLGDEAINIFFVESSSYNALEVRVFFYDFSGGAGSGNGDYSAHIYADEDGLPGTELGSSGVENVTEQWTAYHTFTLSAPVQLLQGQVIWVAVRSEEDQTTNVFLPLVDGGIASPYSGGFLYVLADGEYYWLFENWFIRVEGCGDGPWLTMTAHSSNPDPVQAGGSATLSTTLYNRGFADTAAAVQGTLSCDDPMITVTADSASYGVITQGNSAVNAPDYSIDADATAYGVYSMLVDSTDGPNNWLDGFPVYVQGSGCTTENRVMVTDNGPSLFYLPPGANDEFGNYFIVDSISFTLTSVEVQFYRGSGPPPPPASANFRLKIYTYWRGLPDQVLYTSNWVSVSGTGDIMQTFNLPTALTFRYGDTFWATVESESNLEGKAFGVVPDDGLGTSLLNGLIWDDSAGSWAPLYYSFIIRPSGCEATELRYDSHISNPAEPNPGDTVDLTVTIANTGTIDATNVSATLSSSDPDVTVLIDSANYGTVPGSGTAVSQTDYRVQIAPGADQLGYMLDMVITDTVNNWYDKLPLRLAGGHVVMVYMTADNDLDPFGMDDWNEMIGAGVDDTAWLQVFLLIDRAETAAWSDTRLYEIHSGFSTELDGLNLGITAGASQNELNMGSPNTLINFIQDVKFFGGEASYYLVLWNHGDGWKRGSMADDPKTVLKAVCMDETSNDWLYTQELQNAVSGQGLDLVGFDACLEGMVEVAYEIRNDASVMVGSEDLEPGTGWDYLDLLVRFKQEASPTAVNFAEAAIDTYMDSQSYTDMTLASYDLTQMDALRAACDGMVTALDAVSNPTWTQICNDNSLEWFGCTVGCEPFTDLYHLAERAKVRDPGNAAAYDAVMAAVNQLVLYERHRSAHPNAHGISIYFKCNGGAEAGYDATNIQWAADTGWDEMLNAH